MQTIFLWEWKKWEKIEIRQAEKIAEAIIAEYKPQSVAEMQEALKEVFEPMFEAMLNGEMTGYLGYESNDKSEKTTENRRNGYSLKTIKTSMGEREISVPHDRNSSFESVILPKHKCDVSSIEGKVLAMYWNEHSRYLRF